MMKKGKSCLGIEHCSIVCIIVHYLQCNHTGEYLDQLVHRIQFSRKQPLVQKTLAIRLGNILEPLVQRTLTLKDTTAGAENTKLMLPFQM
jgi:hypothetical protein